MGATLSLLAVATVLLRLPFLTPRLAHWDAVNYALGLHDFNVAAHQPHPPGSPYFILLGRAALSLTGDDNVALIAVSLAASVGAVLGEYALARLLFGTRAGLLAAMKTFARQLAADGVTVNSLLPGVIATDRSHELGADPPERLRELPMRRLGTVEEFAAAAAFLCSEPASYITGTALLVDGGATRSV